MKLDKIQLNEYELASRGLGSDSKLFTDMMHKTKQWAEEFKNNKPLHVSPFKLELDKEVDLVAYYIECGYSTDIAVKMIGRNYCAFKIKITDSHNHILQAARKQRILNKGKGYVNAMQIKQS